MEGKEGGIHNQVTERKTACLGPRKEEALRKEWYLPEVQIHLGLPVKLVGGHDLPTGIPAVDMEVIEPYSLLVSPGKRDSHTQGPFDYTLAVGIIPSWTAKRKLIQSI